MFQLTKKEYDLLLRCQIGTLKRGQHRKYLPYVFTENGVAMLSSVLNSKRAIHVNIQIMRTFTKLRKMLASNAQLARKLKALEKQYDEQFRVVFEAIYNLMDASETKAARTVTNLSESITLRTVPGSDGKSETVVSRTYHCESCCSFVRSEDESQRRGS